MIVGRFADGASRPIVKRCLVEHAEAAFARPVRLGPALVENLPVLTEDEQLRVGLAEVEDGHLHWTAPEAGAIRTMTPAFSSMRASASERPSSVTSVPMRDNGSATLRAWIDSLRLSASTTIWSAQRLSSAMERTSSGCDSSTPSGPMPCAPRKNFDA